MTEDRLTEELARVAREEEVKQRRLLDERWDFLAAGDLSAEDRRELEARAGESATGAAAWEAFRPLGADFRQQLAAKLTAAAGAEEPVAPKTPVKGQVVPFERPRRRRWVQWSIPAAAIAASLVLVFRPLGEMPPLPSYEIVVGGTVAEQRSVSAPDPEGVQPFAAGNRFELVLTPLTAVEGAVSAKIWRLQAGQLRALSSPPPEVAASGTVRLRGTVGEGLDLPQGRSSLVVVVGRSGELPGDTELVAALSSAQQAAGDAWRAWRVELRVQ